MWLGKNLIRLDPYRKQKLATILLWYMGLGKKLNWRWIPTEKKYVFDSGYSIALIHGTSENQSRWTITEKNLLSFPTTVLLWCTVLIQLLIGTWPHRKKLFLATVLDVHETREKISSVLYHRRKKLFVTTVLLWCTRPRNYCSVSW